MRVGPVWCHGIGRSQSRRLPARRTMPRLFGPTLKRQKFPAHLDFDTASWTCVRVQTVDHKTALRRASSDRDRWQVSMPFVSDLETRKSNSTIARFSARQSIPALLHHLIPLKRQRHSPDSQSNNYIPREFGETQKHLILDPAVSGRDATRTASAATTWPHARVRPSNRIQGACVRVFNFSCAHRTDTQLCGRCD